MTRIAGFPSPPSSLGSELLLDVLHCSARHEARGIPSTYWLGLGGPGVGLGDMDLLSVPRLSLLKRPGFWLRPALERALEDGWAEMSPHDWTQHRRLLAAVYRDVEGDSVERVAERLNYGDARSAQRLAAEGRSLLWSMQAWPWACWSGGRPPSGWHPGARDRFTWTTYRRWRREGPHPRHLLHGQKEAAGT